MKYGVMLAAGSLLLAGCSSVEPEPSPELKRLSEEIATLKQSLQKMDGKLDKLLVKPKARSDGFVERVADPEVLAKIKPLPDKPTDAEIRAYVGAILEATKDQNSFKPEDPQVAMLEKIGPGHLKILLPYLSQRSNYHFGYALPKLILPSDKQLIIENLDAGDGALAKLVVENGWVAEARPKIIELFKKGRGDIFWREKMETVIAQIARTPEEREEVVDLFITYPNTSEMYRSIRHFPDIDQADITRQAWESHQFDQVHSRSRYALYAAEQGNIEALTALLSLLTSRERELGYMREQMAAPLSVLLGRAYNPAEMLNYVTANKEKLAFDREKMKYVLKEKQ